MNFIYEQNKIYVKNEDGLVIVNATFPEYLEGIVVIDHTYVDPSLRGQGIASILMTKVCEHIKSMGLKLVATCPYAVVWLKRNKEFSDLIDEEAQTKLSPECRI